MLRIVVGVILLVVTLAVVAAARPGSTTSQSDSEVSEVLLRALESPDSSLAPVVATVNGSEINGELIARDIAFDREMTAVGIDREPLDLRAILEILVVRELVYQEADRRGLLCDRTEVERTSEYMTRGPVIRATYAAHYNVRPEEVYLIAELAVEYAKLCAAVNLWQAVLPPDKVRALDSEMRRMQADFIQELKANATIEILDPNLQ